MLRVNYNVTFGEVYGRNMDGNKWMVKYHPANVDLGAFIYHYKNEQGEKMAQLWNFLMDKQHVKNIMKECDTLLGGEVYKVRLNVYYKQSRDIIEACAKSGYKVECYYKEPKNK